MNNFDYVFYYKLLLIVNIILKSYETNRKTEI